ncbi:MAG: TonB-dependent receptor [Asticcacaulis sp.]
MKTKTLRRTALFIRMMSAASLVALSVPLMTQAAQAQTQARVQAYDLRAQPLAGALRDYMRISGVQVIYASGDGQGVTSSAVKGNYEPTEALSRLLAGTGLTFRLTGNNTATLEKASSAGNAIQLGTIRVEGAGDTGAGALAGEGFNDDPSNAAYRTAGSSNYISSETVQRFRGSSAGDFLSGTPGVINGDNRNSGALDINIRGLQGQGRVPVVIDGAMQESTVWRGYAGVAGRTYLDPDLIGGVVIEKGPSSAADAAGAIGGVARVRTVGAQDIIAPGGRYGFVVRAGLTNNNVDTPPPATVGGTEGRARYFNRPDTLDFNGTNLSVAYAQRFEKFDVVAAVARRKAGNYFSGRQGSGADSGGASGMNAFDHEEQVLNTSQDNTSYLLRSVIRPADGHSVDLSYMRYESEYGEMMPSQIIRGDGPLQASPSEAKVDTYTARYRYKPASDWIDFKADLWATELYSRIETPTRLTIGTNMLNYDTINATASERWGLNVSNTSRFSGGFGDMAIAYGLSHDHEKIGRADDWEALKARHGTKVEEVRQGWKRQNSGFVSVEYKPVDWVNFNVSGRYIEATVQETKATGTNNRDEVSGWTPIVSLLVEPKPGLQVYGRYAEALRPPSLFESTSGFSAQANPDSNLEAEHAHNLELGVNYQKSTLFNADDLLQVKFSWFNNQVTNYITRGSENVGNGSVVVLTNIPRVDMRGVELTLRYELSDYFAELSATRYGDMIICDKQELCLKANSRDGYVTTHLPPTKSATLHIGGHFLSDKLTLGARYLYSGDRPKINVAGTVTLTDWNGYETLDLYGSYKLTDHLSVDLSVDNVTDRFYLDALSLGMMPAPGRTIRLGVSSRYGDGSWADRVSRRQNARDALTSDPWGEFEGDWSGVYAGVHGGWNGVKTKGHTTSIDGTGVALAETESVNLKSDKGLIGAQIGYNHQYANRLVIGFEGDISHSRMTEQHYTISPNVRTADDFSRFQSKTAHEFDWMATARMRIGYAHGRYLVYGTGGFAALKETQQRTQFISRDGYAFNTFGNSTIVSFTESTDKIRSGGVLGLGTEIAINANWSLKTEYLYSTFRKQAFAFSDARRNVNPSAEYLYDFTEDFEPIYATVPGDYDVVNGRVSRNSVNLQSIKFGLNYRF